MTLRSAVMATVQALPDTESQSDHPVKVEPAAGVSCHDDGCAVGISAVARGARAGKAARGEGAASRAGLDGRQGIDFDAIANHYGMVHGSAYRISVAKARERLAVVNESGEARYPVLGVMVIDAGNPAHTVWLVGDTVPFPPETDALMVRKSQ